MTAPKVLDAATHNRMSRQSCRNTAPELAVRAALRSLGLSYRLHASGLPGRPDIVNKSARWAIFVHGCFWHHHPGCSRATVPQNNREWWLEKFEKNARRDELKLDQLKELGFDVLVVWECVALNTSLLRQILQTWFESRGGSTAVLRCTRRSRTRVLHGG